MLYNHFKEEFLRKRKAFGLDRLKSEKEALRNISKQTFEKCTKDKNDSFCQYFTLNEMKFLAKIKERQSAKSIKILTKKYSNFSKIINDTKTYFTGVWEGLLFWWPNCDIFVVPYLTDTKFIIENTKYFNPTNI